MTENQIDPRVGVALEIPKLHWVLRGFWGKYYQPPPLLTASGPVLDYANANNTDFVPLKGERDEEYQFGVQIPFKGWLLDADTFQNRVNNFLDHSNIGNSSMYYPVTIDGALIQAWELTLRSPRIGASGKPTSPIPIRLPNSEATSQVDSSALPLDRRHATRGSTIRPWITTSGTL